jgi:hypothetical protein
MSARDGVGSPLGWLWSMISGEVGVVSGRCARRLRVIDREL